MSTRRQCGRAVRCRRHCEFILPQVYLFRHNRCQLMVGLSWEANLLRANVSVLCVAIIGQDQAYSERRLITRHWVWKDNLSTSVAKYYSYTASQWCWSPGLEIRIRQGSVRCIKECANSNCANGSRQSALNGDTCHAWENIITYY